MPMDLSWIAAALGGQPSAVLGPGAVPGPIIDQATGLPSANQRAFSFGTPPAMPAAPGAAGAPIGEKPGLYDRYKSWISNEDNQTKMYGFANALGQMNRQNPRGGVGNIAEAFSGVQMKIGQNKSEGKLLKSFADYYETMAKGSNSSLYNASGNGTAGGNGASLSTIYGPNGNAGGGGGATSPLY